MPSRITRISKDMTMMEIITLCPDAADVMYQYGMHCIGCHVSSFETLEEGAKVHGLTNRDVNEMIKEMNTILSRKPIKSPPRRLPAGKAVTVVKSIKSGKRTTVKSKPKTKKSAPPKRKKRNTKK